MHESLDFRLSKSGQDPATKTPDETLRPGKTNTIALVSTAVNTLILPLTSSFLSLFLAALVVVVAEHRNR
jgi:hypothetical protein